MRVASPSNMARILITGHDGFTGQFLWKDLQEKGNEPLALSLDGQPVDLRDAPTVQEALRQLAPHKIIHLAAISSVDHGDVTQIYDVNLLGTRNLLEACTQLDRAIEAFILASSANIYGNQSGQMTEASPIQPANDYAVSKAAVEMLAGVYKERLPLITVRPFNYTGQGQSGRFVVAKIVEHLRSGKTHIHLGNLDVARDFSDVRDISNYYAALLECPKAIGQVYNLCSGTAYELRDILTAAQRISGRKIEVLQDPNLMRGNDIQKLYGDPSKINQVMGDYTRHSLESTLDWMLSA
jgi:nucleoside-diphosphate-sugar epimerase